MNTVATPTTSQYAKSKRASSARRRGLRNGSAPAGRSGSLTPKMMTATDKNAGTTAIQNTSVNWLAVSSMNNIASSGPRNAPTVSSDWRNPKLAPRSSDGVRSAMSASRGAPRMPLPSRSTKRAAVSQPMLGASGKIGLVSAARP